MVLLPFSYQAFNAIFHGSRNSEVFPHFLTKRSVDWIGRARGWIQCRGVLSMCILYSFSRSIGVKRVLFGDKGFLFGSPQITQLWEIHRWRWWNWWCELKNTLKRKKGLSVTFLIPKPDDDIQALRPNKYTWVVFQRGSFWFLLLWAPSHLGKGSP